MCRWHQTRLKVHRLASLFWALRLTPWRARSDFQQFAALLIIISAWDNKAKCSKRELLSLIGHLSFAAKVVKPGRLFLRRLIEASTTVHALHHRIHLSTGMREDIRWWGTFLPTWNGVSYMQQPPVSSYDIHLYTDASALGVGGVFGERWFSWPLDHFRSAAWFPHQLEPFNINFWELLALVVAFFTWQHHFRDTQVVIHTDNLPMVHVWSRGSRDPQVMRLVRALFLRAAHSNTNILLAHTPGHSNTLADALSRLQVLRFHQLHPDARQDPSPPHSDLWDI